jgi:hypothetical protein
VRTHGRDHQLCPYHVDVASTTHAEALQFPLPHWQVQHPEAGEGLLGLAQRDKGEPAAAVGMGLRNSRWI